MRNEKPGNGYSRSEMNPLDIIGFILHNFIRIFPRFWFAPAWQAGLIVRGNHVRQFGPGLVFWWPIIHTMVTCVTVRQVMAIQTETLHTKDGASVIVGGVITYTITDVQKYLAENFNTDDSIAETTAACLREVVVSKDLEELLRNNRNSVDNALTRSAGSMLSEFGVTVERVRLTSFSKAQVLSVITPGTYGQGNQMTPITVGEE